MDGLIHGFWDSTKGKCLGGFVFDDLNSENWRTVGESERQSSMDLETPRNQMKCAITRPHGSQFTLATA